MVRDLQRVERRSRRLSREGSVPVLELRFDYTSGAGKRLHSSTRTLFFKRYALTLSVTAPSGRSARRARRQVRRLLRSFRPYEAPPAP